MKTNIFLTLLLLLGPTLSACDQPAGFPQYSKDQVQSYGLFAGVAELFNSTLGQRPTGSHDFDADCPQGGTVHIEGTTQGGTSTVVDVTYQMSDCGLLFGNQDGSFRIALKLNGLMRHTANYDAAGLGGEDLFAEELRMEGDLVSYPDESSIKQTCDLELSYLVTETSITMLGRLCDRDVSIPLWHVTGE